MDLAKIFAEIHRLSHEAAYEISKGNITEAEDHIRKIDIITHDALDQPAKIPLKIRLISHYDNIKTRRVTASMLQREWEAMGWLIKMGRLRNILLTRYGLDK